MTRIAVLGANGRMGGALTRLILDGPGMTLSGAGTEAGHATRGQDAGTLAGSRAAGVSLTDDTASALAGCQVAIDFTAPAATAAHARACAERGCALVVGTTGLGDAEREALVQASRTVPVVYSRNMSLGVTVLTELSRQAARLLGPDFDIEILEAHHRHKKDAPSGTALQLGEAVAAARGQRLDEVAAPARHGIGEARRPGSIGFASLRGGAVVGDHSVLLIGAEETLELKHHAADRALFARGALKAALWSVGRSPGLYSMRDVLGLPAL